MGKKEGGKNTSSSPRVKDLTMWMKKIKWHCWDCSCRPETSRDIHEGKMFTCGLQYLFVTYIIWLTFSKWHFGVCISLKKDLLKLERDTCSCVSHLYLVGNKALNDLMMVFSGSEKTKASQNTLGGRWIVKSRFVRGKEGFWPSLLVWGLHRNSIPPITVFHRTTIASTIITRSQCSFSPLKNPCGSKPIE